MRQEINRLHEEASEAESLRLLMQEEQQRLKECEWRIEELNEEIRVKAAGESDRQTEFRQLKSRLLEVESQKTRKEQTLKDRERILGNTNKQLIAEL